MHRLGIFQQGLYCNGLHMFSYCTPKWNLATGHFLPLLLLGSSFNLFADTKPYFTPERPQPLPSPISWVSSALDCAGSSPRCHGEQSWGGGTEMEETQEGETQQRLTASKAQEPPRRSPELPATAPHCHGNHLGASFSPSRAAWLCHTSVQHSQDCWGKRWGD